MNDTDLLAHLEAESRAFAEAAAVDLTADVPDCPDFDMTGLVTHLGWVYAFAVAQLSSDDPTAMAMPGDEGAPGDDLLGWFAERRQVLLDALGGDLSRPAWTFTDRNDAGFYLRRMLHETVVHRLDAQTACGGVTDVDRSVVVDGIDEVLEVGMRRSTSDTDRTAPPGSLHLHCTDGDGEWLIRTEDGAIIVTHEHAKGDAAVRGSATQILRYLWGRDADVEVLGDEATAQAWAGLTP